MLEKRFEIFFINAVHRHIAQRETVRSQMYECRNV